MPVDHAGFKLKPVGFFDRNPVLNVPAAAPPLCCDSESMSSVAHASAVLGRRACAVLAAASAVLHAALLSHAANPVAAVVLAAMIVACLFCARDLWRWGSLRAWCVVALMNLFMIALHLPASAHHHGDGASAAVVGPATLMMAATLIAAIEVTAAAAVLYYRTRGRSVGISGTPAR